MKFYIGPFLFDDEDPEEPSGYPVGSAIPKNGNAANNQNCWGCREEAGMPDPGDSNTACCILPSDEAYRTFGC